jgi:deoxycytidylate deaminase
VKKVPKKIYRMFSKLEIVVIRYSNEKLKMSKPCKHCIKYLKYIGIKKVHYSDEHGNIISEKTKDLQSEHVCAVRKVIILS